MDTEGYQIEETDLCPKNAEFLFLVELSLIVTILPVFAPMPCVSL
jgi:hypothetical protein